LADSDFSGAQLFNTNFKNARLVNANFSDAFFEETNFSGANIENAIFTSFNGIISLDSARVERYDWLQYVKDSLKIEGADKIYEMYRVDTLPHELYPNFKKPGLLLK
jgi:hypothetical protein